MSNWAFRKHQEKCDALYHFFDEHPILNDSWSKNILLRYKDFHYMYKHDREYLEDLGKDGGEAHFARHIADYIDMSRERLNPQNREAYRHLQSIKSEERTRAMTNRMSEPIRGGLIGPDQAAAAASARQLLAKCPIVIDTETTGLDDNAEVCEIAIIDHHGDVILDTRIKPYFGIPDDASDIHGITDEDVKGAPMLDEALDDDLLRLLLKVPSIAIYNADFDLRILRQAAVTIGRIDIMDKVMKLAPSTYCLMELYAKWWGDWHEYHCSYTWQSLSAAAQQCGLPWDGEAHSALADAKMSLKVLWHIAERR